MTHRFTRLSGKWVHGLCTLAIAVQYVGWTLSAQSQTAGDAIIDAPSSVSVPAIGADTGTAEPGAPEITPVKPLQPTPSTADSQPVPPTDAASPAPSTQPPTTQSAATQASAAGQVTPGTSAQTPAVPAATAAASNAGKAPGKPEEFTLPNGLKVLIVEDKAYPVVCCLMWYRVGSRNERFGATGLSHLSEHLLYKRVGSFKPGEIGASIARIGGQFNGYTSDDFTAFFETLPTSKLELALKIESERMRSATFKDEDVNEEIENIQAEFEAEAKDPMTVLSNEVRASLFQQHPYHNPTMGWRSDVENLTAQQVKAFYDRYFWPDNATLILVGDVTSKTALPVVQKYFTRIPRSPSPVREEKVTEPAQHGERRITVKHPGNKEILQVAYHAPALSESDAAAMVVLEKLLNSHISGRLKTKLVESKTCAQALSSFETKKDPGCFSISCVAVPATANAQQKLLDGVDSLVGQLKSQPVSEQELRRARNQAEVAFFTERDGPYRTGFHLGYFETLAGWQNAYAWSDRLKAVSAADIQRVAKKYMHPDSRVVAWLAGQSAPKAVPKPEASKEEKPVPAKFDHVKVTGYKKDDGAKGPKSSTRSVTSKVTSAAANVVGTTLETAVNTATKAVGTTLNTAATAVDTTLNTAATAVDTTLNTAANAVSTTATAIGAIGSIPAVVGSKLLKPHQQESHFGPRVEKRMLRNGITLLVYESHLSPIVQISGMVKAGEAYEPHGKRGLSALATHLMNQGSARRTRSQLQQLQEDLGLVPAQMLKFEEKLETIDFHARCLSRDLPAELDVVSESMVTPPVTEDDLENTQQVLPAALKRSETQMDKVERVMLQSLLSNTSAYRPADPSEKARTIDGATVGDVQKYFASHIVPGATAIALAGDVTADQAVTLAERSFAKWSTRAGRPRLTAQPAEHRVLKTAVPVTGKARHTVCFGQLIPITPAHHDYGSFLIADSVLDNHPIISRIARRMSNEPNLLNALNEDGVETRIEPMAHYTAWSVIASVEPNAVPTAVRALQEELHAIAKTGITHDECQEVKRYLLGSIPVRKFATLTSVARMALNSCLHDDDPNGYLSAMDSVRSANSDTVNKIIRSSFKPDQCTLVIAGNAQTIRAVRSQAPNTPSR
jgi:zinc protease